MGEKATKSVAKRASTAPKERRSRPVKEDNAEEVPASQLSVRDEIFFPNSRQPQAIESIVDDEANGVRVLMAGDTAWHCGADNAVRRVKS